MHFTKKLSNYLAGIVAGVFVLSFVGTQYDLSIVSKAQAQATDEIIVTTRSGQNLFKMFRLQYLH